MQLLENANKKIKAEIKKTDGVYTKKRYQQISVALSDVAKKLKASLGTQLDSTELIEAELEYQRNQLNSAYKGTDLKGFDFTLPDEKQIRSAVQFAPFCDGANYEQYLNNIYNGFYDTWDNELRTGYMLGTSTKQIIKNVMGTVAKNGEVAQIGSIEKIRQSIERNTRTYLQSMASTARNTLYKENESLFSGYKYLATLDRRTCLPAGEKVLTPNGYRNIEEIKVGDYVIGGSREKRKVLGTMKKTTKEIIEIELENGNKIRCTPNHLILTDRGWIKAGELNENDSIKEKL